MSQPVDKSRTLYKTMTYPVDNFSSRMLAVYIDNGIQMCYNV